MSTVNETLIRDIIKKVRRFQNEKIISQMSGRRMPLVRSFFQTDGLGDEAVHSQRIYRCPACWTKSHHPHVVPAEVKSPRISARVEQRRVPAGARVNGHLPRAFSQRTGNAGQRQILEGTLPSGRDGHNVVDVEDGFLAFLRQPAVFAAIFRALNNFGPQALWNEHELTTPGYWHVERASVGAKAVPQGQPVPQPHGARLRLDVYRDPACPAAHGAVSRLPWADGIWINHRAIRFRSGRVSAYCSSTFSLQSNTGCRLRSSKVFGSFDQ